MKPAELDTPLPQTIDSERAVLGAVLIDNKAFWKISTHVAANDFMRDAHRTLWTVISDMLAAGDEVDYLTLKEELNRRPGKLLEKIGGAAYITGLTDVVPNMLAVDEYAAAVKEKASLRRLVVLGNSIARAAMEGIESPDVIAAEALSSLTPQATRRDAQARTLAQVYETIFADAERRSQKRELDTFETGLAKLDSYRVIRPTLIVVGSPSKHGKSSFLLNLDEGLGEHDHPTLHFSLESGEEEIAWRSVSARTGIPHSRVKDWWTFDENDYRRVAEAGAAVHKLPVRITRQQRSIDAIEAEIRRVKTLHGLHAVTIDYFQLIKYPGGPRDREERMAEIAQRLLEIAMSQDIAIVAASQLNKEWTQRSDGRIHASDLKYAAAIGESARAVLLFQRPHVHDKANDEFPPCLVKFQVEANNEGRTGDYDMHFDEITQRFGEGGCEENSCRRFRANAHIPDEQLQFDA